MARRLPESAPLRLLVFAGSPVHTGTHSLDDILALAVEWRAATGGMVQLWQMRGLDSDPLAAWAIAHAVPRVSQPEGDPCGQLWSALACTLADGEIPLMVSAAGPRLGLGQLQAAQAALVASDAVCMAAPGGGLAMMGLSRAVPELLAGLPWDSERLLPTMRRHARRAQCTLVELPTRKY